MPGMRTYHRQLASGAAYSQISFDSRADACALNVSLSGRPGSCHFGGLSAKAATVSEIGGIVTGADDLSESPEIEQRINANLGSNP